MTPFLVIGYGNEMRGDDAVGPQVARCVEEWRRPGIAVLEGHQLTPEMAAALSDAGVVVFVDACASADEDEVCVRRLEAGPNTALGHGSDPRWLLALAEAVCGRRPEAWLVTIPATDFGLGAQLSAVARAGMAVALEQIERLVSASQLGDGPERAGGLE